MKAFAHVLTRSLHSALLRFELRLVGVPLCPAWLSLAMRRGETDGQIFFNHRNEGIYMSDQTTHTSNDTVDPQFLGPEAGQQARGEGEGASVLDSNGPRFVVEASNSDPAARHGHERGNLSDCETHVTRADANQRARLFLRRGHWVEVYDDDTKELLAGPFDPDQPAPSYIV